jgi:hypothetical protein
VTPAARDGYHGRDRRRGHTSNDKRLEKVMKTVVHCLFVFVLLAAIAAPAYSADPAASDDNLRIIQVWACEIADGVSEADVDVMAQAKLAAFRQMPGGEGVNLHILWPVAVNNTGDVDVHVVVEFPSFVAWGTLWDAYNDASPLARSDDATEGKIVCPDSAVWEAHDAVLN